MQCVVYRSDRKLQTYLYLPATSSLASLPASIHQALAPLVEIMRLELQKDSRLARQNVAVVLANLQTNGFHIQFPPAQDDDRRAW
jgi:uncharacterized protein